MKIWQLMKLHYVYLFSRKNIIAIIVCFLIALGISLYSWLDNATLALPSEQVIELSWQSIFTFDKLIIHIVAIFIMGNFCLPENDQYYCLFIFRNTSRNKFFLIKMLVLTMIIVLFVGLLILTFMISGYTLNHYFVMSWSYLKAFIYCLVASLSFGYLTVCLVKLFPTVMSIIISVIAFLASDVMEGEVTILPIVTSEFLKNSTVISFILMIIVMVFYFFIAIMVNFAKK